MDAWYGEGNYWYRGQAPGAWTTWESFHYGGGSAPVHNGNMTYNYNWGTGVYTDKFGKRVSYGEVYQNYIAPNASYYGEVGAGFEVGDGMAFFMKDGALIYIPPTEGINWKSTLTAGPGGSIIDESWGKMYVITNVGPDAGLMDGHAWIRIESNKGSAATMSLWGNRGEQEFWVNLELNAGYGIINKSTELTQSQFVRLIDFNMTSSNLNWTPWNTCAGYSSNLWNYVTGGNLSATDIFGFTTPRRLAKSILGNP